MKQTNYVGYAETSTDSSYNNDCAYGCLASGIFTCEVCIGYNTVD